MGVRGVSVDTAVGVCKFPGEPADEIDPPGTCGPFVNCQFAVGGGGGGSRLHRHITSRDRNGAGSADISASGRVFDCRQCPFVDVRRNRALNRCHFRNSRLPAARACSGCVQLCVCGFNDQALIGSANEKCERSIHGRNVYVPLSMKQLRPHRLLRLALAGHTPGSWIDLHRALLRWRVTGKHPTLNFLVSVAGSLHGKLAFHLASPRHNRRYLRKH